MRERDALGIGVTPGARRRAEEAFGSPRGRSMRGAYIAGAAARRKGLPVESNPYGDARRPDGGVTYARAFSQAWWKGWQDQGGPNPVFPPA